MPLISTKRLVPHCATLTAQSSRVAAIKGTGFTLLFWAKSGRWWPGFLSIRTSSVVGRASAVMDGLTRSLLLERDHVRAAQRWSLWLQRLVGQVAVALIQDLIKTDGRFVVGGGRGGLHRDDDGVIAQCRSDRCVGQRAADLPADHNDRRDALRFQRFVEIGVVEPVLGDVHDLDIARERPRAAISTCSAHECRMPRPGRRCVPVP
jgi:hypothetical protein